MLPLLNSDKRIINIDETSIPFLDFRKSKWMPKGVKNTISVKDLAAKVNMILAVDTQGKVYAALTQVNTDSEVMTSFLCRLATVLTTEDREWRKKTIWVLDGARYHTSTATRTIQK